LHITNAIYVSNKIKLSSNFLSLFNNKIPISNINFKNNIHVAKTFSLWAQKATNNKILDVILPRDIEEDTTFVLVTGVYFNNRLLNALEGNIEKRRFHVSQTESYYVPMIKFKKALYKCAYIQDWHTIFIEIPLDKNITMIIFLPTRKITLAYLENRFDFLIFQNYRNKLKKIGEYTYIWQLYLPKFKFEITHSLHGIHKVSI
ncbi:Antichymotrypsin-2, partial [Camponotus floridanus]